ncbi:MAG: SUMF1/EgtB/PvdO family nonheme iron enzyme [Anaerolineales bacterium]|nr:SUMF1/EgtB/PvdO family nonheme iron enzyme [Anaerolineales bacterium]
MPDLIGQSLGRYHILEQLGEGGMATVYKAYDTRLERKVAVKVILPARGHSEMFLKRFEREAKALAQLSHANIVKVLDYGEQESLPYLVMEYIPGGTLKGWLGRLMPWQEAAALLIPVARGLAHAHAHNIIHRDIKPSNILLTGTGEPMLSDFGIAKMLESEETLDLTGTGVGLGNPEYMAPEQGLGEPVDHRADIYALGIVFYELVAGRTPFRADTPMAVMVKKATEPLPRPSQFVREIPESVEQVLIKALAREPKNRFDNMTAFASALESLAQGQKPLLPQEFARKKGTGPKSARRWLGWAGLGAAALVICALLVIGSITAIQYFAASPTSTGLAAASVSTPGITVGPPIISTESENTPQPSATPSATSAPAFSPTPPVWGKDGMEMVLVPAGEFLRGLSPDNLAQLLAICPSCQTDSLADAQPQATIYLNAFWIDRTEVTNGQFAQFVAETGYRTTAEITDSYSYVQDLSLRDFKSNSSADWRHPQGSNSSIAGMTQHPVTQVSWQDAAAYCAWAGRRLPTEAEWEKAARGEDGRLFPWGNQAPLSGYLNYNFQVSGNAEVGSYPSGAGPYGALDMSGNLWEWVADYYGETYYQIAPARNPPGPSWGEGRVMRGGSWASEFDKYVAYVTTAFRLWNYDYISSDVLGFRCATSTVP